MKVKILILGAGPTGLGAAWRLEELGETDWLLLEKTAAPGGLAASVTDEAGYTWDYGGHVQFSHYDYFDGLMDTLLGPEEWLHHERESWVWLMDRFVPYPFQNNLRYLPREAMWECVRGLVRLVRNPPTRGAEEFRGVGAADVRRGAVPGVHGAVQFQGVGLSAGGAGVGVDRRPGGGDGPGAGAGQHHSRAGRRVVGAEQHVPVSVAGRDGGGVAAVRRAAAGGADAVWGGGGAGGYGGAAGLKRRGGGEAIEYEHLITSLPLDVLRGVVRCVGEDAAWRRACGAAGAFVDEHCGAGGGGEAAGGGGDEVLDVLSAGGQSVLPGDGVFELFAEQRAGH
jgi:hypothetical protein